MSKLDYLSSKLSLTFRVIVLAILAKSSHSCLFCLCRKREYPVSFQNKSSKLFFQMSVQIHSVPGQTEGRGKIVGERVMLTIIKVFIILFLLEGKGSILEILKINQ